MQVKLTTNQQPAATAVAGANDEIKLYSIENNHGTTLTACNLGATVVSLLVKDRNGKFKDVVLGYDDPLAYVTDEFYIGGIIGRFANRIAGNEVFINGHAYQLTTKAGGYHQHGGNKGFNKKLFSAALVSQPKQNSIVFSYTSPHLEEGFPGELTLEVIYTLDDEDVWTVEYKAASSKTTLVNFTQHTYFNLTGNPANKVDEHQLKILSQYYLPVNDIQVPTGELCPVKDTPFDFLHFKTIGQHLKTADAQLKLGNGYDHSFILEKQHSAHLKHATIVKEPGTGIQMDVYTTEPSVHLYSGNYLKNVKGKKGIIYQQRSGLCLETQHFPDAPNHPHFPSTELKAGEQFYSKTIFKFSVE